MLKTELLVSASDQAHYREVKFFRERLTSIIARLTSDEMVFLLFRVGSGDKHQERINDAVNVIKQLGRKLNSVSGAMLQKIQNIMRHIEFVDLIINRLMK